MKKILGNFFSTDKKSEEDEESLITEEELIKKKKKLVIKINRRERLKRVLIILLLGIGTIGGYKGLLSTPTNIDFASLEDQAFINEYVQKYYQYPALEEDKNYIINYSLDPDALQYSQNIESTRIDTVTIYKVDIIDNNKQIYRYYIKANYYTKLKDTDNLKNTLFCEITLTKLDGKYLVIKPISNITTNIDPITDKDILSEYKNETKKGSKQLDETTKADVQNTIILFLKTYNTDIVQAKLLVEKASKLDKLDSHCKLELTNINNATADEEIYYVDCRIKQTYQEDIYVEQDYHFEINIEKNKIIGMEVY